MGDERPRELWAFHRGALGDSVLLWPRLRDHVRSGWRVVLVTDNAKARLAEREVGVEGVDAEQQRFHRLWIEGSDIEQIRDAEVVLDFMCGGRGVVPANLARMFPGAKVISEPPPRGGTEAAAWSRMHPRSLADFRGNDNGPIVLHVGAGGQAKRWAMQRWAVLARELKCGALRPIAGEVEAERFSQADRALFESLGGRFLGTLEELADALRGARLVIGCDSGPAHLAAQLGVRTLALFGPSDPSLWAPVGPAVRTLAPMAPAPMDRLDERSVLEHAQDMMHSAPDPSLSRAPG